MTEQEVPLKASDIERPAFDVGRGAPETSDEPATRFGSWSVRRAIEVLDEAIDRMGSQLARASEVSTDWTGEPPGKQLRRPAARAPISRPPDLRLDADPCEPGFRGPDSS